MTNDSISKTHYTLHFSRDTLNAHHQLLLTGCVLAEMLIEAEEQHLQPPEPSITVWPESWETQATALRETVETALPYAKRWEQLLYPLQSTYSAVTKVNRSE